MNIEQERNALQRAIRVCANGLEAEVSRLRSSSNLKGKELEDLCWDAMLQSNKHMIELKETFRTFGVFT